jgi:hypothetical protein
MKHWMSCSSVKMNTFAVNTSPKAQNEDLVVTFADPLSERSSTSIE